jgi:hypothetical protein
LNKENTAKEENFTENLLELLESGTIRSNNLFEISSDLEF